MLYGVLLSPHVATYGRQRSLMTLAAEGGFGCKRMALSICDSTCNDLTSAPRELIDHRARQTRHWSSTTIRGVHPLLLRFNLDLTSL